MQNNEMIPEGYMLDPQGRLVPKNMVKEIDLLRDSLVLDVVQKAQEYSRMLLDFKTRIAQEIEAFVELSGEKYGVHYGGKKGNLQLVSFSGDFKIVRAIADLITFDERLQFAKQLIDECVHKWAEASTDEVKALVNHAFQVDKTGKVNVERILSLRKLDIKNEKWKSAMEAISDSIQVLGSRSYIRIYRRDVSGKYQQINLDLAAL